jgi:hypothetical protein
LKLGWDAVGHRFHARRAVKDKGRRDMQNHPVQRGIHDGRSMLVDKLFVEEVGKSDLVFLFALKFVVVFERGLIVAFTVLV